MQAKGSLTETPLSTLLEGAQSERATGILTVRREDVSYSIYFLFGHLFHAAGHDQQGDQAVISALSLAGGEFHFDAKAKLPSDETVKASIPELIAAGPNNNGSGPSSHGSEAGTGRSRGRQAADDEAPQRRGVKHRPQPKNGREPIPVPAGEVVYDSLKTSFVDFPRLITTLENEGYTGYVRLLSESSSGLILFREGAAQECAFDTGAQDLVRGLDALREFNNEVTHGHGVLDVVGLPESVVDGLYDLVMAQPLYRDLYAAWIDMPALLVHLDDNQLTGAVMVRAEAGTGIVILTRGKVSGAYTSEMREISSSPEVVLALCADKRAVIEVKSADHSAGRVPLDVAQVVGNRPAPGGTATTATPPSTNSPARPAVVPPPTQSTVSAAPTAGAAPQPPMPTAPDQTASLPTLRPDPPATAPAPMPAAPTPPTLPVAPPEITRPRPEVDWEAVIVELQGLADKALGARSRKVKDLLAAAERTPAGVEQTVSQVSQISLLFVDSALLVKLEQDMKAALQAYQ